MYVPRYEHQYSIMPPLYSNINLRDLSDLRVSRVQGEIAIIVNSVLLSSEDITRSLQTHENECESTSMVPASVHLSEICRCGVPDPLHRRHHLRPRLHLPHHRRCLHSRSHGK